MCGITGFLDFNSKSTETDLLNMVSALKHRGPDDYGAELESIGDAQIGLGHTRLSIIDLSPLGHQPMTRNKVTIVFNGEIYNYCEIKEQLVAMGHSFKSDSDTEVILEAYAQWGIECVKKFTGMFAFCLVDREKGEVYMAVDRAGVKPLYIYRNGNLLLFGSELKALYAHPKFEKEIDKSVLPEFLNHGYIAAPKSIFKNTQKVLPGYYIKCEIGKWDFVERKYWDLRAIYNQPKITASYSETKEELHSLLKSAFNYRMIADVPVGVFLSGGYDSSAVASVLTETGHKVRTFTIGFEEGNNEAPQAKEIANRLGTEHFEYYCSHSEAIDLISDLPFIYDEPFADSSAIPMILVSKMAKKEVDVALSADGGDEQLFGYNSYFKQLANLSKVERIKNSSPRFLREMLVNVLGGTSHSNPKLYQGLTALRAANLPAEKRAGYLLGASKRKPEGYIKSLLLNSDALAANWAQEDVPAAAGDAFSYIDYIDYLPNDILPKVDRATMSASLEGREPFLDHRIAEFAARMPLEFKYNSTEGGKRILKDIVHQYIPKSVMDQPKRGFTVPINSWLKKDLNYLLEEYLSEKALKETNTFNVKAVMNQVALFKADKLHYTPIIWYILTYQMWYFRWFKD